MAIQTNEYVTLQGLILHFCILFFIGGGGGEGENTSFIAVSLIVGGSDEVIQFLLFVVIGSVKTCMS